MPLRFPVKAIIFVFVIALAAMYQETPAQKKQPKKDTATATKATSRFRNAIRTKATAAMIIAGQLTSAAGIKSRDTTAMTPTTAALTPARNA